MLVILAQQNRIVTQAKLVRGKYLVIFTLCCVMQAVFLTITTAHGSLGAATLWCVYAGQKKQVAL